MPLPQNLNVLLGAGVFGIVCAATLYVVGHYRQDRRRHAINRDLQRLNSEFAIIRRELDNLLAQQNKKEVNVNKRKKRSKKDSIVANSTTTEDYSSAFDAESSDLEFYDVSDEEVDPVRAEIDLTEIDRVLEEGEAGDLTLCIQELENLCLQSPENPQLLWRLGKAHYRLYEKTENQQLINKGIDICKSALHLSPQLASVHKWLAILLAERTKFQPMKEKIIDGYLFKEHVEEAVKLDPDDSSLHHMLGRFAYDVSELKWYERKVAAALFGEPPSATFDEALNHFLEADRLSEKDWKENTLFIAKSRIKLGNIEEALRDLERAAAMQGDEQFDAEIKELLKKHKR